MSAAASRGLPVAARITEALRREIVEGRLAPGAPLAEPKLARRFEASRAPVREALISLEREGLVEFMATGRSRVLPLAEEDLLDICRVRGALESLAAGLVVPLWNAEVTLAFEAHLALQEQAATVGELTRLDMDLHEMIVRLSGSPRLIRSWLAMRWQFEMWLAQTHRRQHSLALEPREITVAAHRRLLEVLSGGDPATAAAALSEHVHGALEWWPRGAWSAETDSPTHSTDRA